MTRRGRALLRALATVLLVGAVVTAVVALQADDEPEPPTADTRRAATPLWSARRVPFLFVDTVANQRLVVAATTVAGAHDACLAIDDADRENGVVARIRADIPLVPASTTKLLTATAALEAFGPEHTFTTRALLDGDTLYLIGGGDPVLTTPEYETRIRTTARTSTDVVTPLVDLADAIVAAGITEVSAIVADDSRHDDVRFLPGWRESYLDDIGALSALTVDDGFDEFTRVDDPALLAAQQLGSLLTDRGVAVGGTSRGTAPAEASEIASVASPPLGDIVASMVTSSDNLTAELLMREIGGDGTTETGTRRTLELLANLGIPTAGLDLRDGSGLHPENRVSCDALLAVLQLGRDEIDRGLAIAGRSGTLVNRLQGDALEGVLRAKTGQINGVAGLAGVVDDAEDLRFAYLVNGDITTASGQSLQVDVARVVAAYPEAPPADELVPIP